MGLLSKKPVTKSVDSPLYTVGAQSTLMIVGLGNPGAQYDGTRHNIGFYCLDHFVKSHEEFSAWQQKSQMKLQMATGTLGSTKIIAIKPATYMNLSGQAVAAAQRFYKIPTKNIFVIHDELDLPFGQIRSRYGGGSAGHNGISSIIDSVGEEFGRIRVGISNETAVKTDTATFVLWHFLTTERQHLPSLAREIDSLLVESIYGGQLPNDTRTFMI